MLWSREGWQVERVQDGRRFVVTDPTGGRILVEGEPIRETQQAAQSPATGERAGQGGLDRVLGGLDRVNSSLDGMLERAEAGIERRVPDRIGAGRRVRITLPDGTVHEFVNGKVGAETRGGSNARMPLAGRDYARQHRSAKRTDVLCAGERIAEVRREPGAPGGLEVRPERPLDQLDMLAVIVLCRVTGEAGADGWVRKRVNPANWTLT